MKESKYYIIFDTNSYAGNFERELCAYATGVIGDCGVGEEFIDVFIKEEKINYDKEYSTLNEDFWGNLIGFTQDDDGCWRPVNIDITPGTAYYSSVRIILNHKPTIKQYELIKNRGKKFATNKNIQILNVRLMREDVVIKTKNLIEGK